jgi:pimeloyl-ACP methyl ester carboxylesterase
MATMRFAVDFPEVLAERVSGLALMSTSARPAPAAKMAAAGGALTLPFWGRALRRAEHRPRGHMPSTDLSYLFTRVALGGHPSQTHVELTKMMTAATSPAVLADLMESAIYHFDVTAELPEVDVATEVIVGSRDNLTPPRHARLIASLMPRAELTVLPGCGHMAMLERRREVEDILVRLATRTARSSPA